MIEVVLNKTGTGTGYHYNIPVPPGSAKYGRPEFDVCFQYEDGLLKNLYISPRQQPEALEFWRIDCKDYHPNAVHISSWEHKGIEHPKPWLWFWCKEHEAVCTEIYAPPGATWINVSLLNTLSLTFSDKEMT